MDGYILSYALTIILPINIRAICCKRTLRITKANPIKKNANATE
jgi:hypothetical protein